MPPKKRHPASKKPKIEKFDPEVLEQLAEADVEIDDRYNALHEKIDGMRRALTDSLKKDIRDWCAENSEIAKMTLLEYLELEGDDKKKIKKEKLEMTVQGVEEDKENHMEVEVTIEEVIVKMEEKAETVEPAAVKQASSPPLIATGFRPIIRTKAMAFRVAKPGERLVSMDGTPVIVEPVPKSRLLPNISSRSMFSEPRILISPKKEKEAEEEDESFTEVD